MLPIIMAGAMFVQYKLNPAPPDPMQAKVFMILPLVMSVTFAFFPAGLVLYWTRTRCCRSRSSGTSTGSCWPRPKKSGSTA